MDNPDRPPDKILATRTLKIERKTVTIEVRENYRGRFLKVMEMTSGKRNIVIIPECGINEFNAAVDAVVSEIHA